ncbi:MAG: polyprenyl synthetase family protein [Solirubrobacteraceae bacterium]|nr:polyprenyl synthetase family protein [Solirubrobacteraceae bacterium]
MAASSATPVAGVLGAGGPRLAERVAAVDALVAVLAGAIDGPAGVRAAGLVASGGKRLRPLLTLLLAGDGPAAADEAGERSLRVAAAATELIHVATLAHDDVLDRAPTRRGVPTIWSTDGAEAAVATGDALLAAAFEAVSRDARPEVSAILATAASSLAAGELMQRADAFRLDITVERYEQRVIGKTAALFEAACRLGAIHGGVDAELAGSIGRDLGIAFQLLDDLLDIEGDPAVTGKARGTDLLDGTVTLPLALAAARDPEFAAVKLRELDEPAAAELCDRLIASGTCDEVRASALGRVEVAQAAIAALPGPEGRRQALALAARALVDRSA